MTVSMNWKTGPQSREEEDRAFGPDHPPEDEPPFSLLDHCEAGQFWRVTFRRVGSSHMQHVTVAGWEARDMWAHFEALYPFRRFVAHGVQQLPIG